MKCYIRNMSAISPQPTFATDSFLSSVVVPSADEKCLKAIEPDYKVCIKEAGLRRRMSHVIKMGVASALNCVEGANGTLPDAIITATGLGCLADTEKFLQSIIDNDERLLNPTSFIQSTFNTIGGQVALLLKCPCYNFTYVHRGFSFESALLDAMMQLEDGDASNVLVGGIDEVTDTEFRVMERMGFWRSGAKMGEGAQFFLLSSQPTSQDVAQITSLRTFLASASDGTEVESFLDSCGLTIKDIDCVLLGESGDAKMDATLLSWKESLPAGKMQATFKHLCGEYQTASSFGVWCAANLLRYQTVPDALRPVGKAEELRRILVFNSYRNNNCSLFLLEKIDR
ncbi:MAG: beta-ketoacyl synthase chain length factor [Paludibacteraceae bacterium]|nr:beta-ketoacyl synthase chain length factor [Paludibacteraceae bacterium]